MGALAARHPVMSRPNSGPSRCRDASSPVMRLNKRGLAGAVRTDDQPALARLDRKVDVGGVTRRPPNDLLKFR
jgi:hypothetical protein